VWEVSTVNVILEVMPGYCLGARAGAGTIPEPSVTGRGRSLLLKYNRSCLLSIG